MDTCALARNDPRTPIMQLPNDKEKKMIPEERPERKLDRLMEEITILRIEGTLFCFNPREARRRTGKITTTYTHADGTERPVTVEIHPSYGQPSVLAYKIVQAVFLKIFEDGYPYESYVTFTQRELARLVGRAWCGATSKELYHAMMQLQTTLISCSMQNKETKEYLILNFHFLSDTLFSTKDQSIKECVVKVADPIVHSLNRRHIAYFNLDRLDTLETLGMVLYKRIFFHFSNLYQTARGRAGMRYEKNYEDICEEWLGGLKAERYASKAHQQLSRHLEAIKKTGLLSRYAIEPRANGKGLKLVFVPGDGFYEDYENYYLKEQQAKLRAGAASSVRLIQQPLDIVGYFHKRLGHEGNLFADKETAQALKLLEAHGDTDVRDLVDYAIEKAGETRFRMEHFGAVLTYVTRWQEERSTRAALAERRRTIAACPFCRDHEGYLHVKDRTGSFTAVECPHDAAKIKAYEDRTGLRRL